MSDLLQSLRNGDESSTDGLLTEVSTQQSQNKKSSTRYTTDERAFKRTEVTEAKAPDASSTPQEILESLRLQPDIDNLVSLLKTLSVIGSKQGFDIRTPGPIQAQIIHVLVNTTLPTFWSILEPKDVNLIVSCLRCVAGIQALVTRLKLHLQPNGQSLNENAVKDLEICLSIIELIFKGENTALILWTDLAKSSIQDIKKDLTWKELATLLSSGKIISVTAQAEDVIREHREQFRPSWLSKGSNYATWLGRNIASLISAIKEKDDVLSKLIPAAARLLTGATSLGYPSPFVSGFITSFTDAVLDRAVDADGLTKLFEHLTMSSRRQFLEQILRWLSTIRLEEDQQEGQQQTKPSFSVSSIAAILSTITGSNTSATGLLSTFLADPVVSSSLSAAVRRAIIFVISEQAPDEMEMLLEKCITQFGNRLFIDHTPLIQQESLAQALLLAAGYVHRKTPMAVLMTARSSGHMQGVSNRLDSSNQRARWLGMVVGVALSSLIDKPSSRMNFGTDDMNTVEARWYLGLVDVSDQVGSLSQFRECLQSQKVSTLAIRKSTKPVETEKLPIIDGKQVFGPPRPPVPMQTEIIGDRVTEVFDEMEDTPDSSLKPYAKPDSDPEDSDEDATLVNRNKPRAPVYIRDLMRYLADDKDYEHFNLGIQHAAKLIRRKARFGNEVKDHAHELAATMCNLQDPFNIENFDELRLQALIATLLTDVDTLAPWLSQQAFSGDYSLSQRCIILSALGLGGRELAGLKEEDSTFNPTLLDPSTSNFPTKRLPPHLHKIYSPSSSSPSSSSSSPSLTRLSALSTQTSQNLIQPLALSAADTSTSHLNPVKVRNFSSRRHQSSRTKLLSPPSNLLSKIFLPKFFSPLLNRYQLELASYGSNTVFLSSPFVLVTFVKTLALLLHASGPATLGLHEISEVFWDFLLTLRTLAAGDIAVLEAVLFALMTLLGVNAESEGSTSRSSGGGGAKQGFLGREMSRQVMETKEWVETVFERIGGGGGGRKGDEETRVRALAAGVLVRVGEVLEEYQKVLMGG